MKIKKNSNNYNSAKPLTESYRDYPTFSIEKDSYIADVLNTKAEPLNTLADFSDMLASTHNATLVLDLDGSRKFMALARGLKIEPNNLSVDSYRDFIVFGFDVDYEGDFIIGVYPNDNYHVGSFPEAIEVFEEFVKKCGGTIVGVNGADDYDALAEENEWFTEDLNFESELINHCAIIDNLDCIDRHEKDPDWPGMLACTTMTIDDNTATEEEIDDLLEQLIEWPEIYTNENSSNKDNIYNYVGYAKIAVYYKTKSNCNWPIRITGVEVLDNKVAENDAFSTDYPDYDPFDL